MTVSSSLSPVRVRASSRSGASPRPASYRKPTRGSVLRSARAANALVPSAQVKYYPKATIGDVACKVVEVKNSQPVRGAVYHLTRLYLHDDTNLPIRLQHFSFPKKRGSDPQLFEEYTYMNVKTDVGLKNIDFDISNPKYNY